jgi:hypothetical protein
MERDELVQEAVDREEALRERGVGLRGEAAGIDHPDAAAAALHDAVAHRRRAGVDPKNDHRAVDAGQPCVVASGPRSRTLEVRLLRSSAPPSADLA